MNRIILLVIMLIGVVAGVAAQDDADAKYASELLKPGVEAPDFTISNSGSSYDGTSLSSLRGKYVVVDFWASWCPDCRKDIRKIRWMNRRFASDSIVFVGVSFDKSEEAWRKCIADSSMTWMQHREQKPWKETKISKDYNIKWIPSIYLIGPDGRVVLGTVMPDKLRKALGDIAPEAAARGKRAVSGDIPKVAGISGIADFDRFPGGCDALQKYLKRNMQYPDMATKLQAACHVVMHYTVNPEGSITDITATDCKLEYINTAMLDKYTAEQQGEMRKECVRLFAKEGYRLIKSMPKWKAARNGGPLKITLPLNFTGVELIER